MSKEKKAKYQSYVAKGQRVIQSLENGYNIKINLKRMEGTCAISEKLLEPDCEVIKFENVHFIDEGSFAVRNFFVTINKKHAEIIKNNFGIK